jgi:hypothetical protein
MAGGRKREFLHFLVFSKPSPPSLSSSWAPPYCHMGPFPTIPRSNSSKTGKGHRGRTLGLVTSHLSWAKSVHLSVPWKLGVCQSGLAVPHAGLESPASRLEMCLSCYLQMPSQAVHAVVESHLARSSKGTPGFSPMVLCPLEPRSPSHPPRSATERGRILDPKQHFSFPGLGSFLCLHFIRVIVFLIDCHF